MARNLKFKIENVKCKTGLQQQFEILYSTFYILHLQ